MNSSTRSADSITFSIQHPDLTSGLVAPEDALAVGLVQVSCLVDLSIVSTFEHSSDAPPLAQCYDGSDNSLDHTTNDLYDSLTMEDQRAIDEFVLSYRRSETGHGRLRKPRARMTKVKRRGPIEDMALFHKVLEAAMVILIRGASKKPAGVKILEGASWSGLINLAPGVFHMDYLKVLL